MSVPSDSVLLERAMNEVKSLHDRLEAAEAKVEAARALVGRWRVNNVDTLEYRLRRELADELSTVLDPSPYEVVCSPCGKTVARIPKAIGEGFEDARHKLMETLREHFEACEGAER